MIHVEHLHKNFGPVHAVDDVSFDVMRGEVVGLLGPNGAGKTTTMRILTGFLNADKGQATIDGIAVNDEHLRTRSLIGYLPENAPVYVDLEVTEYLTYIAKLRSIPGKEILPRVKEMVDTCGLGQVLGRTIGQLSKGYKQRVGLAAAMIHKPPVLILDEPTSGLDPNQIVEIRNLIKEIGRKRTVILSTHILQEVEATCSRALIISGGKLVGQGTIEELLHRGASRITYTIAARAPRARVEYDIAKLRDMKIGEWLSEPNDATQRCLLTSENAADRSEDIFRWAVDSGLVLSELKKEAASLEEVFRELTQS